MSALRSEEAPLAKRQALARPPSHHKHRIWRITVELGIDSVQEANLLLLRDAVQQMLDAKGGCSQMQRWMCARITVCSVPALRQPLAGAAGLSSSSATDAGTIVNNVGMRSHAMIHLITGSDGKLKRAVHRTRRVHIPLEEAED